MTKSEYYAEERAYEAVIEREEELRELEEQDCTAESGLDPAFSSWSDFYAYMYG